MFKDTLLSQRLSKGGCINGYRRFNVGRFRLTPRRTNIPTKPGEVEILPRYTPAPIGHCGAMCSPLCGNYHRKFSYLELKWKYIMWIVQTLAWVVIPEIKFLLVFVDRWLYYEPVKKKQNMVCDLKQFCRKSSRPINYWCKTHFSQFRCEKHV